MNRKLITDETIDPSLVSAAESRARRFIHDRRPAGIGFGEVRDDILLEFVRRRDAINAAAERGDVVALGDLLEESVGAAFAKAANESRKNIRRLVPHQVRTAAPGCEDAAYDALAADMRLLATRQSVREREVWFVRCALDHLTDEDRGMALAYMRLGSWGRVVGTLGMSEGHFRRHVLPGFLVRFRGVWQKCR